MKIKLSSIRINPNNPRFIEPEALEKLTESISSFPKMMELRPIIVDDDGAILGGNMRFAALKRLKYTEVPPEWIKFARSLTIEEKKEFLIKDNLNFGDWDYEVLENEWDKTMLIDCGFEWEAPEAKTTTVEFKQSFNFTIKCKTAKELKQLQKRFSVKANKATFEQFFDAI